MFGNHFNSDRIARIFNSIDENLRNRFIRRNNLNNENHYTQLFAEHVNMQFAGVLPNFTYSTVLHPGDERKFGCDGMIIFQYGNDVKIGLFEAKWPFRNGWDYPQAPDDSHFTNQIKRQCAFKDDFAIWEYFYDSRHLPNSFILNNRGSMCSWHKETHDFQRANVVNRVWRTTDVASLIGLHGQTVYQIIYSILMCQKGKKHLIDGESIIIRDIENEYVDSIPLPLNYNGNLEENQNIKSFMSKNGLSFYTAIDMSDLLSK